MSQEGDILLLPAARHALFPESLLCPSVPTPTLTPSEPDLFWGGVGVETGLLVGQTLGIPGPSASEEGLSGQG